MKTRFGTCYFANFQAAENYYAQQGDDSSAVMQKIIEGLIYIGKPNLKPGEKLLIDKNEGRYIIES